VKKQTAEETFQATSSVLKQILVKKETGMNIVAT
jgi:hypothetical protein